MIGAKPAEFCWWLFDLLGALPGDELVDLFDPSHLVRPTRRRPPR